VCRRAHRYSCPSRGRAERPRPLPRPHRRVEGGVRQTHQAYHCSLSRMNVGVAMTTRPGEMPETGRCEAVLSAARALAERYVERFSRPCQRRSPALWRLPAPRRPGRCPAGPDRPATNHRPAVSGASARSRRGWIRASGDGIRLERDSILHWMLQGKRYLSAPAGENRSVGVAASGVVSRTARSSSRKAYATTACTRWCLALK
jgi:hypothetical protein